MARTGKYEEGYPLDGPGDEVLDADDITIWARVEVDPSGEIHNRVVFRREAGGEVLEGIVACVHLAIYSASLDELDMIAQRDPGFRNMIQSTEGHPVHLPPEEHFFALKSYVAGLANVGIFNLLSAGVQPGFNEHWHRQAWDAIIRVVGPATLDFLCQRYPSAGRRATETISEARRLDELSQDPHEEVRMAVASNHATPPAVLGRLARDRNPEIRKAVTANPHISFALLEILAQDPSAAVRAEVARSPAIPPGILERLAQDPSRSVRHAVAKNPHINAPTLRILATSQNPHARKIAASNPALPPDLFERLTTDPDAEVRNAVMENRKLPRKLLRKLVIAGEGTHKSRVKIMKYKVLDPKIVEQIANKHGLHDPQQIQYFLAGAGDLHHEETDAIARDPQTPPDVLAKLAKDRWWSVRMAVAGNPNTPWDTFLTLARDRENPSVRHAVANSPRIPVDLLEEMALDANAYVRDGVAGNPKARPAIIAAINGIKELMKASGPDPGWDLPEEAWWLLCKSRSVKIRAKAGERWMPQIIEKCLEWVKKQQLHELTRAKLKEFLGGALSMVHQGKLFDTVNAQLGQKTGPSRARRPPRVRRPSHQTPSRSRQATLF